jgi:hypothetical protein
VSQVRRPALLLSMMCDGPASFMTRDVADAPMFAEKCLRPPMGVESKGWMQDILIGAARLARGAGTLLFLGRV